MRKAVNTIRPAQSVYRPPSPIARYTSLSAPRQRPHVQTQPYLQWNRHLRGDEREQAPVKAVRRDGGRAPARVSVDEVRERARVHPDAEEAAEEEGDGDGGDGCVLLADPRVCERRRRETEEAELGRREPCLGRGASGEVRPCACQRAVRVVPAEDAARDGANAVGEECETNLERIEAVLVRQGARTSVRYAVAEGEDKA
jgi:hypothetical protein